MPINTVERFNQYKIDDSITSLGNVSDAIDYNAPLEFKSWLGYFKDLATSTETYRSSYKKYLSSWNLVKNTFLTNQSDDIKEAYITLLKDISLDVYTAQERQYIASLDYSDPNQLDTIIPLVTSKIKDLTRYYKNFREIVKTQPKKNNIYSSNIGIREFLYQLISDLFNFDANTKTLANVYSVNSNDVLTNINIVIDELYDDYQNYFDVSATVAASAYEYGGNTRTTQWSSNTNVWDYDLFIDYDQSVVRLLSSYNYVLENFIENLALPVILDVTDNKYLKNKDFIDQFNTGNISDLNLVNKKELFQKYIGTDWYYLSTGTSTSQTFSGKFLEAENISENYLNRVNVSTATTPNTAFLVRSKDIGGYYTPNNLGILIYNTFSYNLVLDVDNLTPNTKYYFPDPTKYISTYGNSRYTRSNTVFNVIENAYVVNFNISNAAAFGYINDNSYYINFHGYENIEERQQIYNVGTARDFDKVDFFKGNNKNIWSNADIYHVKNTALYPIDNRQYDLLVSQRDLVGNTSDIYGNNYGIFKNASVALFDNLASTYTPITETCLFLSNGLYIDPNGGSFNYADTVGYISDIIPSQIFDRSGVTTVAVLFTDNITSVLTSGIFAMPWCYSTGNTYRAGNIYDCVSFVDTHGDALPDTPSSDNPSWNPATLYSYYNILIDAGADINGLRPNVARVASFTYELSGLIDCGRFSYYPAVDPFTLANLKSKSYNIPYVDTQLSNLSTTYVNNDTTTTRRTIYDKKYLLKSTPIFRDINSGIYPLSAALSAVFAKYDTIPTIFDELNNDILKFDIIYDVAIIETSNYIVIERIDYDYTLNSVNNYTDTLTYISRTTQGDNDLEQFSNFYFHERHNNIVFGRTTLLGTLSASNFRTLYPTFYKFDIDSLRLKQIFPANTTNLFGTLINYSFRSVMSPLYTNVDFNYSDYIFNIASVDRPSLSYESETNNYAFICKYNDLSDCMCLHYQIYKYINGDFINQINESYFQNSVVRDENYFNPLTASFMGYNSLPGSPGVTWVQQEGVLKIGE